ncbi:MAG TPA: hypothetical protein VES70_09805, partial [Pseudomonas sp.]|nr:hypothetical protein [Pseudomonas sp.]
MTQRKRRAIARPAVAGKGIKHLYELCLLRTLMGSTCGNNLPARIPKTQLLDAVLLMSPLCRTVV